MPVEPRLSDKHPYLSVHHSLQKTRRRDSPRRHGEKRRARRGIGKQEGIEHKYFFFPI
jgi:hypothetical protein